MFSKFFSKYFTHKSDINGLKEVKTVRYVRVDEYPFQVVKDGINDVNNNIYDIKESINSLKKVIDDKDLEIKRLKNKYQVLNLKHATLQSEFNKLQKPEYYPNKKIKKN